MKINKISDEQLVLNYQNGNDACIEILIKRYKSKIYSAINMIVYDKYLAEDIFQEAFIKVIHTLRNGKYNSNGKFLPWVITIARNLAIDLIRKTKRLPTITDSEGGDVFEYINVYEKSKEDLIIEKQSNDKLRDLIKLLPMEQKEVLILRHYADLSFKEIAAMTNTSINTSLGRMRYALINLKKMFEDQEVIEKYKVSS